jgi:hypothetical protein
MDKAFKNLQMEICIKVTTRMENLRDTVNIFGRMEVSLKAHLKMD